MPARRIDPSAWLLLPLLLGCGGQGDASPPRVVGPVRAPSASASAAPSAAPAGKKAEAPDAPAPDPESRRLFLAGIARPSVVARRGPPPHVTALALANTALGEAAQMTSRGAPITADLTEGQRVMVPVAIEPGECATFIAQGGLGVIEVDLFLAQGDGEAATILAQDLASGPIAVIGGHRGCFKNPGERAIAADLHALLRRGAGPVVVQSFRR